MPQEFVKQRVGASDLAIAVRQQEQLSYFTQSSIQEDLPSDYFDKWAERNHTTSDDFLNYAKNVFRTDNFVVFAKYLRTPIISSELVDDRIRPELERVFFSENSYSNYSIRGENFRDVDELQSKKFTKDIFNALLFNHNDIVVINVPELNSPEREIVSIKNVVALESRDSVISRIAYSVIFEGQKGFLYMDKDQYAFLNDKHDVVLSVPHDLGECPADYISNEPFGDRDIVRKSIFSKVIRRMENYVFLDTMLRMTEPNGVIPVATILKGRRTDEGNDIKEQDKGGPMSHNAIQGQKAGQGKTVQGSNNIAQPGANIEVPMIRKEDSSVDMEVAKSYINFFHMPVEPLEFIQERVDKQEKSLLLSVIGDFSEGNESAMNELQVGKGYKSKEDRLRDLSVAMTEVKKSSDKKFLSLANGKDNVSVDLFFGSDFFMETQEDIYKLIEKKTNPIEKESLLIKSSMNRNRFNEEKQKRDKILYKLLPYTIETDFDKAITRGLDDITFQYQSRFNYWIWMFEAQFGNIVEFAEAIEGSESEKILLINNLIINLITTNTTTNGTEPNSNS